MTPEKLPTDQQKGETPMPDGKDLKEQTAPQEMKEHILNNTVDMVDNTAKCVDGGYKPGEAEGELAIPGGHAGVVMTLMRLGYSPEKAYTLTKGYVESLGQKFGFHTDTHEGHNGTICGCGHCNAAMQRGEEYGLDSEEVKEMWELIKADYEQENPDHKTMDYIILDREHAEKAILVITGTKRTVRPWDQEADTQYFIYEQTRHQDFLKGLLSYLQEIGEDKVGDKQVNYDELWQAAQEHTNATLGLLGSSKGKPMYAVNVDEEVPVIEYLQNAPVID